MQDEWGAAPIEAPGINRTGGWPTVHTKKPKEGCAEEGFSGELEARVAGDGVAKLVPKCALALVVGQLEQVETG